MKIAGLKMGHIELLVKDTHISREFYEKTLGFSVTSIQEEQLIWLELEGIEILLRPGKNVTHPSDFYQAAKNFVLYTGDLEKTRRELESRGVEFTGEDQGCPLFQDPDGNWFQLVSPFGE